MTPKLTAEERRIIYGIKNSRIDYANRRYYHLPGYEQISNADIRKLSNAGILINRNGLHLTDLGKTIEL